MNTYFRSLYYGIALCLGFIGLFGLLIDAREWGLSLGLMACGVVMAGMTYGLRNFE
jgi:hypothetical protein